MAHICNTCVNYCEDSREFKRLKKECCDCGDYIQRLDTRQKIIIDGYYVDNKDTIQGYVCVVNDMGIRKDDDEIFYYFENWKDVDLCKNKKTTGGDFIITEIYPYGE